MKNKHCYTKKRNNGKRKNIISRKRIKKGGLNILGVNLFRFPPACNGQNYLTGLEVKQLFDDLEKGATKNSNYSQVSRILAKNCPLLGKYINFWNLNRTKLINIYNLQSENPKFPVFLLKEYNRNKLTGNLNLTAIQSYASTIKK